MGFISRAWLWGERQKRSRPPVNQQNRKRSKRRASSPDDHPIQADEGEHAPRREGGEEVPWRLPEAICDAMLDDVPHELVADHVRHQMWPHLPIGEEKPPDRE
jgi:hypothetical protein